MKKAGIVGYGAYVPKRYILAKNINEKSDRLGFVKKSLASWDEDSITMGVEASTLALKNSKVKASDVGALYFGSESPIYAVNPSSTIIADVLGVSDKYHAVDLQFACKAATAGLQMLTAHIGFNGDNYGLVIGSDKSQAKKGDVLEWSAGAAAGCLVVGKEEIIAELIATVSISSDTPDFWRREGVENPSHGGRFTGKPAYFSHVMSATKLLFEKTNKKPSDFNHVVFHMPNGRFPLQVGKLLGFSKKQLKWGMTVSEIGNPYSASSLLGLISVLEFAKPGELILMTSYGSGAGSDSFCFRVTEKIRKYPRGFLKKMLLDRDKVSLAEYSVGEKWV